MKKLILMMIILTNCFVCYASEISYEQQVHEEIAHKRRMKELAMIHQIYADQIRLGKSDINIENNLYNRAEVVSNNSLTNSNDIKVKRRNK